MNKHYESIHRHDFLTKELLKKEYLENELTDKQIAAKYNVSSKVVIWRKRKEFGIQNRFNGKSNKNAKKNRKFDLTKEKAENILASGQIQDVADYLGCSLVVAKRRLKELGLSKKRKHAQKYLFYHIEPTYEQKQLLIGTLLGDGQITNSNAYSAVHSHKQKAYLDFKNEKMNNFCARGQRHTISKEKDIYGDPYESYSFTTGCNQYCEKLRKIYYPNGEKVFPYAFLLDKIDIMMLAYWYMDDGTFQAGSFRSALCTYGFTCLEQLFIQKLLLDNFSLTTQINFRKERKDYYIQFNAQSTRELFSLIRPHIVPSMMYKVDREANRKYKEEKKRLHKIKMARIALSQHS